jgi:unsaturated rhamnogalacturonyl hydrolase
MTKETIVFVLSVSVLLGGRSLLLAEGETYEIAAGKGLSAKKIVVTNPIAVFRDNETVSLNWKEIEKTEPNLTKDNAAVYEFETNRFLVTQVVEDGNKTELLFQTSLAPNEKKYFRIMKQPEGLNKPVSEITTYCRFVPERKDDFAWENDKVAFRMYGPALEYETITCGIDAWVKCVPTPVVDKFYKEGDYHKNHGQGGDFYKVGNTLGCGGMAPLADGKVVLPRNFIRWKVIASGPVRSIFELTYNPWQAGGETISETKRISLDLGSNLNRIECLYNCPDAEHLTVAAGIILRESSNRKFTDAANSTIAYWLPSDGNYGMIGCGVVFGAVVKTKVMETDGHLLLAVDHSCQTPIVYYSGSCWDENKEFGTFEKWQQYLINFKKRIDNPIRIQIQN